MMMSLWRTALAVFGLLSLGGTARSQERLLNFSHGHFDQWIVRHIPESVVIGGSTREVYEIGPRDTIKGDIPYRMNPKSPWATSNVMAKVSGVTKCSVTVFPEQRENGYCARLDTRLENCKVLGMFNITVLASGTVFLGEMVEPIKDTKNPNQKLNMGVPFTGTPKALVMDYKFRSNGEHDRTYAPGFGSMKKVAGRDYGIVFVYLQKRWEDESGNVFAQRVGTGVDTFRENTPDWMNGYRLPINYGNITGESYFNSTMGLLQGEQANYCRNSTGKIVPIQEVGWGEAGDKPTHLIVQISSSYGGAYTGAIGNSLWVDNVKLAY